MPKKYLFLILWLIALDAITKDLAYMEEEFMSYPIYIIPWILSLEYAQNTGIAFSIPITGIFLKILTVVLIFGIFLYYWREERPKNSRILDMSFALIFAGALWNAWERIFRWYVTDFISVEHFAIFNLADSYITLGAIWILWYYYKNK